MFFSAYVAFFSARFVDRTIDFVVFINIPQSLRRRAFARVSGPPTNERVAAVLAGRIGYRTTIPPLVNNLEPSRSYIESASCPLFFAYIRWNRRRLFGRAHRVSQLAFRLSLIERPRSSPFVLLQSITDRVRRERWRWPKQ